MPENTPAGTPTPDQLMPIVLRTWRHLLNDPDLTADDDFFANGGDSVLADEAMLQITATTGIDIPVATLFISPTPAEFVQALTELTHTSETD